MISDFVMSDLFISRFTIDDSRSSFRSQALHRICNRRFDRLETNCE